MELAEQGKELVLDAIGKAVDPINNVLGVAAGLFVSVLVLAFLGLRFGPNIVGSLIHNARVRELERQMDTPRDPGLPSNIRDW